MLGRPYLRLHSVPLPLALGFGSSCDSVHACAACGEFLALHGKGRGPACRALRGLPGSGSTDIPRWRPDRAVSHTALPVTSLARILWIGTGRDEFRSAPDAPAMSTKPHGPAKSFHFQPQPAHVPSALFDIPELFPQGSWPALGRCHSKSNALACSARCGWLRHRLGKVFRPAKSDRARPAFTVPPTASGGRLSPPDTDRTYSAGLNLTPEQHRGQPTRLGQSARCDLLGKVSQWMANWHRADPDAFLTISVGRKGGRHRAPRDRTPPRDAKHCRSANRRVGSIGEAVGRVDCHLERSIYR